MNYFCICVNYITKDVFALENACLLNIAVTLGSEGSHGTCRCQNLTIRLSDKFVFFNLNAEAKSIKQAFSLSL